MPHLIIEYAQDLIPDKKIPAMIDAVHLAAMSTGLFEESHIKTRATPMVYYRLGNSNDPFIHAQLRILSGRDEKQKCTLSETVLNAICDQGWPAKVVTVEVVDMDRSSYSKHTT